MADALELDREEVRPPLDEVDDELVFSKLELGGEEPETLP